MQLLVESPGGLHTLGDVEVVENTRGMQTYLEAGCQLPGKHQAIQLVGAVGHEVTLISHTPAVQCQTSGHTACWCSMS